MQEEINEAIEIAENDLLLRDEVEGHRRVRVEIRMKTDDQNKVEVDAIIQPVLPKHSAVTTTCIRDGKRLIIRRGLNKDDDANQMTIDDVDA